MRRVAPASAMLRRPRRANWATPTAGQQRRQEFGVAVAGLRCHPVSRADVRRSWHRVRALSSHRLPVERARLADRKRRARSRDETNRPVPVLRPRSREIGPASSPHAAARMAWSALCGTHPKAAVQRRRHSRHRCNQIRRMHGGAGSCSGIHARDARVQSPARKLWRDVEEEKEGNLPRSELSLVRLFRDRDRTRIYCIAPCARRSRLFVGQFAEQTDHEVTVELREGDIHVVIRMPRLRPPIIRSVPGVPRTCSPLSLMYGKMTNRP